MLEEVGFDVDLQSPPWEKYLEGIFTTDPSKHPDMNFGILSTETFDSSKPIGQYLICDGPGSVVCEPEIDRLFAAASSETDDAERAGLYHQIWQKLHEEARIVSINEVLSIVFTDEDLQWKPEPDGFYRIQSMRFAG
jgi:peptide/nickel transport system substrate-binding protein